MNLSFFIANAMVMIVGFMAFFYLNSLNRKIEKISTTTKEINFRTSDVSKSVNIILLNRKKILRSGKKLSNQELLMLIEETGAIVDNLTEQLKRLGVLYRDTKIDKEIIPKMLGYVDSLKLILTEAFRFRQGSIGVESVSGLVDKILDSFIELQSNQNEYSEVRYSRLEKIVAATKKTMMMTLACTFLFIALLGLIIPGKIALPFKKIKDAIRELQECNFDVSIYYDQDDEIGEISKEMNKMIQSMKKFEELRADHIAAEHKKFDTLASLIKKYVLVANAKGELIYMNNQLYSLMNISSDEVLHKDISDILIPKDITDIYQTAIKRRTKIENAEVVIKSNRDMKGESKEPIKSKLEGSNNGDMALDKANGEEVEILFKGYANVIPIRGKESSLDYYLMVLSREIFS